jgi:SOS-response transcriptional repressor LexA
MEMTKRRPLTEEEIEEAQRLKRAWDDYKLRHKGATQTWLAQETNIGTQGAVGQYLLGKIPLNLEALFAICAAIGEDPAKISPRLVAIVEPERRSERPPPLRLVPNAQLQGTNTETAISRGYLPLISWVQAGAWAEIVDGFQPGDAEDWIPCPFHHGPHAFILRVVGLSMYNPDGDKSYAPGEYIAVDPDGEPMHKKMVVVRVDQEEKATFKQLLVDPEGTTMLQALNPAHTPRLMELPPGSRIVGTVIGKWVPE